MRCQRRLRNLICSRPVTVNSSATRQECWTSRPITHIRAVCDKLLTDKATPIIVVTIDSMAQHGGANMPIETFAALLFNQWQIGHAKLEGQDWNTGILLLVSKGDRGARIELVQAGDAPKTRRASRS